MGDARPDNGGMPDAGYFPAEDHIEAVQPPAWEQVENGRYMPRRIRGSNLGRELG
jgi:hypothetical protein